MKVFRDLGLEDFETWSGATDTKNKIIEEGKQNEFDEMISELYPDGIDSTSLNDLLWFEDDWIYEQLRIKNN